MPQPRVRLARLLVSFAVGAAALATVPTPAAQAASSLTGSRVVNVTHTSFTVKFDSQGDGWKYRLYASTNKPDVYYDNLPSAPPYHSALKSKARITLSNLPYRTKPYWWRVQAYKGSLKRTGDLLSVGLLAGAPTGLTANRVAGGGLSLSWGGGASNGYQIQAATDAGFTTGVQKYTIRGVGTQFSPYGLSAGRSYFFRVRAANNGSTSPWSSSVTGTAARQQDVLVGTFNIREQDATNNNVASWKDRRDAVVRSVRQGGPPDVLAIQEGASFVGGQCSARQVDDLANRLGTKWKVAKTEPIPCKDHPWKRTGVYVIYNSDKYRAVGDGGHWEVSTNQVKEHNFAAYQQLENINSGARMLFVSVHLQKGQTTADDKERKPEMENLLADVKALGLGLPVVYAGDYNSHDRRAFDGPGKVMVAHSMGDAWWVAQKRVNKTYNSANAYLRKPPRTSTSIDHVSGAPGVALKTWKLVIKLKDGHYVGVIPSDHNMIVSEVAYPF